MGTVPTGVMERELRALYLRWLVHVVDHQQDLTAYVAQFEQDSRALIAARGGQAASLGALTDFPTPKLLTLSPVADVVYNKMTQAAIQASIQAGLGATDAARQIMQVGLDQNFRRLNKVARTETVRAYWNNSWDSIDGLGLVMVWSAEKGPRTCDYCLSRDGLVVEDRTIFDHPQGRCTLVAKAPSQVKYRGTLMPGKQAAKPVIQHTQVISKPAAAPEVQPAPVPAKKVVQNVSQMTPQDKVKAAEQMYGTGSPQHQAAIQKFTPEAKVAPKLAPEEKYVAQIHAQLASGQMTTAQLSQAMATASPLGQLNGRTALARYEADQAAKGAITKGTRDLPAISDAFQKAVIPPKSGGFSRYVNDERIKVIKATPEGSNTYAALRAFQDGGSSIARLRNDTYSYITGGATAGLNPTRQKTIETLLGAMNQIPAPEKLWRGMRIKGSAEDVLAQYAAGTDVDIALGSFTSQRSVADRFAAKPQGGTKIDYDKTVPVRFEWADDHDMTALPLQNISTGSQFYAEKEWVVGGRFKTVDARISQGTVVVRITRTEKW